MRLLVKGRNLELSPSLRDYAEGKLGRLAGLLSPDVAVELELAEAIRGRHLAEATVFAKGSTLHASESAATVRASIDRLAENLERQVTRYRDKRRIEPRRRAEHHRG